MAFGLLSACSKDRGPSCDHLASKVLSYELTSFGETKADTAAYCKRRWTSTVKRCIGGASDREAVLHCIAGTNKAKVSERYLRLARKTRTADAFTRVSVSRDKNVRFGFSLELPNAMRSSRCDYDTTCHFDMPLSFKFSYRLTTDVVDTVSSLDDAVADTRKRDAMTFTRKKREASGDFLLEASDMRYSYVIRYVQRRDGKHLRLGCMGPPSDKHRGQMRQMCGSLVWQ